jgi:hypothetical protein
MKFSNLISKFHLSFARVFWALNMFDSLFLRHATNPEQDHQVNLKDNDQTQTNPDAAQMQLETMNTGVMACWIIGPNYTWCHSGRGRN